MGEPHSLNTTLSICIYLMWDS